MDKYEVQTGLNRVQNPVILCSPEYYDLLIDECRRIFQYARENGNLEQIIKEFPALAVLGQHPKFSEIQKGN